MRSRRCESWSWRSIDLRGLGDLALLLVSWAAALRRSELVALEVADLGFEPDGLVLTIRRSKTGREGAGSTVVVPLGEEEATCPVGALGPSLSDRALAEIVAARADAIELEGDFAGHSLRAGFATAAARAGRSEDAIMRHGRWKSVPIGRRYIRQGAHWDDNPLRTSDCNCRRRRVRSSHRLVAALSTMLWEATSVTHG